jgi:hypothetical protein
MNMKNRLSKIIDVIHGQYDRFVHPSSMQDAQENLNKVAYSKGLYDNMQEHAGETTIPDYPYSWEKFCHS